jgi:hypothetical protein
MTMAKTKVQKTILGIAMRMRIIMEMGIGMEALDRPERGSALMSVVDRN